MQSIVTTGMARMSCREWSGQKMKVDVKTKVKRTMCLSDEGNTWMYYASPRTNWNYHPEKDVGKGRQVLEVGACSGNWRVYSCCYCRAPLGDMNADTHREKVGA